jgi:pimeloyl-ACP methyl ester carboxylesterase/quercetin dioxygenase-like cupin family protein
MELSEHTVDVDGTRVHYLRGGSGPPVLLLHGWPQSSLAWRPVAALLEDHALVIPDLPGFGGSSAPARGHDAASIAADLHHLVASAADEPVLVVGHDWGGVFGYMLASRYPDAVDALVVLEMAMPGTGVLEEAMRPQPGGRFLWHFGLQMVDDVPELLVAGRERRYVDWFFDAHAAAPAAIPDPAREAYAAALARPGALAASLGVYRAYFQTAGQIAAAARVEQPVHVYGGDASLGDAALHSMRALVPHAEGGTIPHCGHWVPDEAAPFVADAIRRIRGGVPTVALAGEGEAFWGLGGLWIIRAGAAQTGGSFSLLEVRMTQGCATPLHRHAADEETFIVLEGRLALLVQGERVDAGPGAVVHLPGGEVHAWRVESPEARFLVIATPQHEAFYRECCVPATSLSQPPDAGQIDLSVIVPAGRRHGVEIIAPPPAY